MRDFSNLRNVDTFLSKTPDWSWLNGIFTNKKIKVGDMDGWTERAGHLLMLEVKSPGASIPLGQDIGFRNLSQSGTATIIVLWGNNDEYTKMRVYTANGKYKAYDDIDNEFVVNVLQQWERWAIKNSKLK